MGRDHKATTVADTITHNWIAHHGVPLRLHCDNVPEFRGHVLKEVKELLASKERSLPHTGHRLMVYVNVPIRQLKVYLGP